mmetsp:Transcript_73245/g.136882  ORF Transcript_73245/g.136882 Transcript_73245/m.136882 type:complete len:322 (+) Transcript_73245:89-1054(+)
MVEVEEPCSAGEVEEGDLLVVLAGGEGREGWLDSVEAVALPNGTSCTWPRVPQATVGFAYAAFAGRLYMIGGIDLHEEVEVAQVNALDLMSATWLRGLPCMRSCRAFASAAVVENHLFALGGHGGEVIGYLSSTEQLQVSSNASCKEWVMSATMQQPRADLAAACSQCGQVYAVGGRDGSNVLGTVETWQRLIAGWQRLPSLQQPRARCIAVVPPSLKVDLLVAGGFDDSRYLASVESFRHEESCWTSLAPLMVPRAASGVLSRDDGVLVFGGETAGDLAASVESLQSTSHEWTHWAALPSARAGFAAAAVTGEAILDGFG